MMTYITWSSSMTVSQESYVFEAHNGGAKQGVIDEQSTS